MSFVANDERNEEARGRHAEGCGWRSFSRVVCVERALTKTKEKGTKEKAKRVVLEFEEFDDPGFLGWKVKTTA